MIRNLNIIALRFEIPMADADILPANLRGRSRGGRGQAAAGRVRFIDHSTGVTTGDPVHRPD